MPLKLPPTSHPSAGWGDAAPRARAALAPNESAAPGSAPPEAPAQAPRPAFASVPVDTVNMSFEVGSAQGGLTLRLTDAVSGKVVREIRLESAAPAENASAQRPGQIVDLRA